MSNNQFAILMLTMAGCLIGSIVRLAVGGRWGVLIGCSTAAVLDAVAWLVARCQYDVSLMAVVLGVAVASGLVWVITQIQKHQLLKIISTAEKVGRFGYENFSMLDHDRDGLITGEDLWAVSQRSGLSGADRDMVRLIVRQIGYIGHLHKLHICNPSSSLSPVLTPEYAISCSDFHTFTLRMDNRYVLDFGPF